MANIFLLTEKYTPDIGGLAISAGRIARLLVSAGHAVKVFAPTTSLPAGEEYCFEHEGVRVHRFSAHKQTADTLADWFDRVTAQHKAEGADLLHAFFLPQAGFVSAFAGNFLGLPSVVSARGNDLDRAVFDPARAAHILYALQHASAVTTNASNLVNKACALVPGLKVSLIPNGVDAQHFCPLQRNRSLAKQLGLDDKPVIGFAGELREKKGLKPLLNAYAQIAKVLPAHLLIVGDLRPGDDQAYFSAFLQEHSHLSVHVTGYVSPSDLPAYYALMDVLAIPSLHDGLPNALLEGMACERATVTTPIGGMADVIRDGENGCFVEAGEAKALADQITNLLQDKAELKRLGQNARKTILHDYTLQKELDGNLTVYRQIGLTI
jgi:glycosyltransferase involved in cell wall biosynthesis